MAGAGIVPGQLTHRQICGLLFLTDRIADARRNELAAAVRLAVAGMRLP